MTKHRHPPLSSSLSSEIRTVSDLKRAVSVTGGHYFDPDTMRFWGSRVEAVYGVPGGAVWVESNNQFDRAAPRRYSVKTFLGGNIDTAVTARSTSRGGPNVADFQAFAKLDSAKRYAQALARKLR